MDIFQQAVEVRSKFKSHAEAAAFLGIPESTFKSRYRKGVRLQSQPVEEFAESARQFTPVQDDRPPVRSSWTDDYDAADELIARTKNLYCVLGGDGVGADMGAALRFAVRLVTLPPCLVVVGLVWAIELYQRIRQVKAD